MTLAIEQVDVAGIKLGMSPDEVRAVLRAKNLLNYNETAETLSFFDAGKGAVQTLPNGRFVSLIAAWNAPPSSAAAENYEAEGESFEVMFTPVPGKERAMVIVHTVGLKPSNGMREVALETGLIKKYGSGVGAADDLPAAPTWRVQHGGSVLMGDACNRRSTVGGLGKLSPFGGNRENLALKKSPDELKWQLDQCGVALVTEDHHTLNGGAMRSDRIVTRFTVTAYSPSLALDGAKSASQLIQAAGGKAGTTAPKDQNTPGL